jgi:hypothetical protein
LAGEQADAVDQLAGHAHAWAGGQPTQGASHAIELNQAVQRACGQFGFQLPTEVDQVPAQAVLRAGAFGHDVVATVGKQPDLHRAVVQERRGEALNAFAHDSADDGQRVDLVRLARTPFAAP